MVLLHILKLGFILLLRVDQYLTLDNGVALTPPMGWMSWQRYRCETNCDKYPDECISEKLFKDVADLMVSEGYKDAGYEYLIIDDCWLERERSGDGKLQADKKRFPNGMKHLSDYIHSKGLKFGLYEDYGTHTCGGYPGVLGHIKEDVQLFAEWEVDYIKLDGCYSTVFDYDEGYPEFGRYLNATGRSIVYSCSWPAYQEYKGMKVDYARIAEHCNLWRNWVDIDDSYSSMVGIMDHFAIKQDYWQPFAGPGHWNDPDMLLIGNFGLSEEQSKTQMAIWAILAAPLLMSTDLRNMKPEFKKILQNKDIIAINQDRLGIQGRRILKDDYFEIWTKPIEPVVDDHYSYAVAVVSRRTDGSPRNYKEILKHFGLENPAGYIFYDLYANGLDEEKSFFFMPDSALEARIKPTALFGSRHFVVFMLFLGIANAYIMRTNMSVAIVAMMNHTASREIDGVPQDFNECVPRDKIDNGTIKMMMAEDGEFVWDSLQRGVILSAFFYGYVITQIPFGLLAKEYGATKFLSIGMLINSIFGLLVPVAAHHSFISLIVVRFVQGLGEGPIVPCTHAILANWIPPNERSRLAAFVYAGAQFGTIVSLPASGFLANSGRIGGWPSIFYTFGGISLVWSVWFFFSVYESPAQHPRIAKEERTYIVTSVWGDDDGMQKHKVPWKKIALSLPFWAILIAHTAQNYAYETLLTQLPSYMHQILHFDIKANGIYSSLPYIMMWIFAMVISFIADALISSKIISVTTVRKINNSIGEFGPALVLIIVSYTGCHTTATIALFTLGSGLNGAIYSGFKVNHIDLSPRFAGVLISFTNCIANFVGLVAPQVASMLTKKQTLAAWASVFYLSAVIYIIGGLCYLILASGTQQDWDSDDDEENSPETNDNWENDSKNKSKSK